MSMFSVEELIQSGGLLLIAAIVFAESGLLIGFFLPGDTLLLSAGIFAARGDLPLNWLILTIIAAAIIGDNVGYSIGRRMGRRIFTKKESLFFRPENMIKAEEFYEKHGGKTVILARFVPIVRTFAPVVAGVGSMSRGRFMAFNVIGAVIWGAGVTLLGYAFGSRIPHIDKYIMPIVGLAMVATFGPALFHLFRDKKFRDYFTMKLKRFFKNILLNKNID